MKRDIKASSEVFKPKPIWAETSRDFEILTIDELESIEPPESLVGPFLRRPGLTVAYGAPKSGKTFLLLDMALRKATGLPWHDGSPTTAEHVVWVAAEGDRSIQSRVKSWVIENQAPSTSGFRVVRGPVNLYSNEGFDFGIALDKREVQPSLIVFDTLARCTTGADENRASDLQRIVDESYQLTDKYGASVVLIHHSGKDARGPRGSNALLAAADQVFRTSLTGRRIKVKSVAERDSRPFDDFELELKEAGDSLVVRPASGPGKTGLDSIEQDVHAFLEAQGPNGWSTASKVRAEFGLAETTLSRRLKSLARKGLIEEADGQGKGAPKLYRSIRGASLESTRKQESYIPQVFPPPPPLKGGVGGGGNDWLEEAV
jgi:hypothetical protein